MKHLEEFVEQVRARMKYKIKSLGKQRAASRFFPSKGRRVHLDSLERFMDPSLTTQHGVRVAYKLVSRFPEDFEGIDASAVDKAGDFFKEPSGYREGRGSKEAASFLASCFGWRDRGQKIHVPVMPVDASIAALGRLATALGEDPVDLTSRLRRASNIRKAAMSAVREVHDVEY